MDARRPTRSRRDEANSTAESRAAITREARGARVENSSRGSSKAMGLLRALSGTSRSSQNGECGLTVTIAGKSSVGLASDEKAPGRSPTPCLHD
jgi:hypothetical protein